MAAKERILMVKCRALHSALVADSYSYPFYFAGTTE
jgi:hypothetical protein